MEPIVKNINEEFRELCTRLDMPHGRLIKEFQEINERLLDRRCIAAGKVLPIFVKPYFITKKQVDRFKSAVETVLTCQEKAINLYFEEPRFRHLFELTENEEPLVSIPHGLSRHIHFSRLDGIMTPTSFKFLEFNCDSPGGAYYADIQTELLLDFSVIRELSKKFTFLIKPYRPIVLETLLKAWQETGHQKKPNIAVIGNPEVANVEEFKLFAEYFSEQGYTSFFTDPWSLTYDGNTLKSHGRRIDLIYRRGVLADYSRNPEQSKAAVQAYHDGNVCFVNPLSSKLGDNKNLLSVLTDESTSFLFTMKELKVLRQHLPWTRMLRECKTEYEGSEIDLIPYVLKNKDNLVVKPNSEYGGKGVIIGQDATQAEWEESIAEHTQQAKVVQEYVPIPIEEFPLLSEELQFAPKKINVNFFTFSGQYGGGFCRVSDSSVINISAGGALVVLFVVDV
ncbi:circularly permuted type 2 ATP-grasp protein [candidate division CSSED10-310 bacterium]|uniref:Circularly permuted type 2 ATP-grasp protein n=1 Tax=candidate division CSSED10-310 bacterium TaxID=2855610 RepID=A0ABV6YWE3_UNCC1